MFNIFEVAGRGFTLKIRNECLLAERAGDTPVICPLTDISAILLTEPAISLSGYLLAELGKREIPFVCCDSCYLPTSMLTGVNFAGKLDLIRHQLNLTTVSKRKLWQKIIQSKIAGQNTVLEKWKNSSVLSGFSEIVQAGDSTFVESRTAAAYWKALAVFPKREQNASDANILFNYGYAILYAAVAREIAVAGLLPDLGICHHHRDNKFNLASDLMEPFRPCIDHVIMSILSMEDFTDLNPQLKQNVLSKIYAIKLKYKSAWLTLFSAVRQTVRSFVKCVQKKQWKTLQLPNWDRDNYVDCNSF